MPQVDIYDVIIVGAGPAGLTAGIYCGRAGLNAIVLEGGSSGGNITNTELVENFPGFPDGIPGPELSGNLMMQTLKYGVRIEYRPVIGIAVNNALKIVKTTKDAWRAKTVIIAGGCRWKRLGVKGEEEIIKKKIFFCAMCDGHRFSGQPVAVIGGGDGGVSEALYMSKVASKVTVVEVLPNLTATSILVRRLQENPKASVMCSTKVEGFSKEEDEMVRVEIEELAGHKRSNLRVAGVFLNVGLEPQSEYLREVLALDEGGFIQVTNNMETSVPGIFAAGDIRSGSARQAITAAGDGATAAVSAQRFLASNQG